MSVSIAAPVAARRPVVHRLHGEDRVDEWAWLRDRDDAQVVDHLTAENAYTEAMTEHARELRENLFDEIVARIQETDLSAPEPHGPWMYFSRTEQGRQYPVLCRRRRDAADPDAEQIILDENALAEGHEYFNVGDVAVSPDHRILAYSVDTDGSEVYSVRFRDLERGVDLDDVVERAYYSLAWASDSTTVFGTHPDAAMRPYQVWRHRLGDPATADAVMYQEDDERFFAAVARTRSGGFIVLGLGSHVTSETRVLSAADPRGEFSVIEPRRQGVEYSVDHHGDRWFIVTNDDAVNFRLMDAPVATPGREHWRELIAHDDSVKLDGVDAFERHLVLYERAGGQRRIRVAQLDCDPLGEITAIDQPESVSTASPGANHEWDTQVLRFEYSSLITPASVIDLDLRTGVRTVVKQQPVLGGYDPAEWVTERLWATAPDGTQVPISLVHHRDVRRDGSAPALLYGYGSYEHSVDPVFRSTRLSLLERGFVFAIAHVRGGGEMGRRWYEDGKLAHKMNTFTDFVACAERLVEAGYTSPDRLGIRGGSAGGLLMGAVVNLRPDLARAVVAEVPFVDVVTTMLDASLPLTVIEWEEWGNPTVSEHYAWMRAYSPYDNVAGVAHPAMLVTGGLNDPRVGFWEPAKWVQRLRDRDTGDRRILLKMELGAGHAGPSGRYDTWREEAFVQAFLLDQLTRRSA
jgi:oligopeptidase B